MAADQALSYLTILKMTNRWSREIADENFVVGSFELANKHYEMAEKSADMVLSFMKTLSSTD
jgi:hypothetical protein